ncbi:hypothetical protein [Streptomyces sp. NPDC051214]|uniref:hypothetical protein n=1 Tax=Streptomyces sp. NPDC051214 TaxID=3155282 RepID=UPI0034219BB8
MSEMGYLGATYRRRREAPAAKAGYIVWDSSTVAPVVGALTCVAGYTIRLLLAQIHIRGRLQGARIEEEGRIGRIEALGDGGFLLERDEPGQRVVVVYRQGPTGGAQRGQ